MDSSSPYGIYVPDWSSCSQSQEKKESTMNISRIGIDLAKNVFQLHGVDRHGKMAWKLVAVPITGLASCSHEDTPSN